MSEFSEKLMSDIKTAMKAKDTVALNTLRALKSAMTNASIEKGGLGTELTEAEETALVRKQVKQRQDSVAQYEDAGRTELADKEKAEIAVLENYLPKALTADELDALVKESVEETGASSRADMGKVMKVAQEKAGGRADGKELSQAVMKQLS